jgi:MFS family permease
MDTLGAVIGPALALLFLFFFPGDYKKLFYIAFVPGIVSIGCTFLLKEPGGATPERKKRTRFFDFFHYWKAAPAEYRKLVTGLLLFAVVNSSDMFLILKIKASGFSDRAAIGVYIFYNLVYALLSYPLGGIGDRLGFKKVFIGGLLLFALVYFGMGVTANIYVVFALFLVYGAYAAATDGVSKAWITNITDKKDAATAIGTFNGFQSICGLAASSLAGLLWFSAGPAALFITTAIATVAVCLYLSVMVKNPKPNTN